MPAASIIEAQHAPPSMCGARKRQGEGTCELPAGWGTPSPGFGPCKLHGGNTRTHRVAAAKDEALHHLTSVMGGTVDIDPHEALLLCVRLAAGSAEYASRQVAQLDSARPGNADSGAPDDERERREQWAQQWAVWVQARSSSIDQLAKYAKLAADAGVDQKQLELAERWGAQLADIVRGVLVDIGLLLGVTLLERPDVRDVVQRHLLPMSAVDGSRAT